MQGDSAARARHPAKARQVKVSPRPQKRQKLHRNATTSKTTQYRVAMKVRILSGTSKSYLGLVLFNGHSNKQRKQRIYAGEGVWTNEQ
jgi:hypothetical protein